MTLTPVPELFWLTATILMTALFWLPYILQHILETGLVKAVSDPDISTTPQVGWGQRAKRAHGNAVENLVIFAPLVVLVVGLGLSGPATATACGVYFFARLVHFSVSTAGVPVVRTLSFAVGVMVQIYLAVVVLGHLG